VFVWRVRVGDQYGSLLCVGRRLCGAGLVLSTQSNVAEWASAGYNWRLLQNVMISCSDLERIEGAAMVRKKEVLKVLLIGD